MPSKFQTRRLAIAYLYGQFDIGSQLGPDLYSKTNQAVTDDYRMTALENPPGRIAMKRDLEGPRPSVLAVTLDQFRPKVSRYVCEVTFPHALPDQIVREVFDESYGAFYSLVPDRNLKSVEVNFRASFKAPCGDAAQFMTERLTKVPSGENAILGRVIASQGVVFQLPPGLGGDISPEGAGLRITVEPLREDPKQIYVETVCAWQRIELNLPAGAPEALRESVPKVLNAEEKKPTDYIAAALDFCESKLHHFLTGEE